jgi:outer membrane biosynthesis protein TonB
MAQIPYWQSPWWQRSLFDTVQSVVHRPDDTGDGSTPDTHVTVGFTFANGDTQDLEIVSSTGDAGLDQLVLQQVGSAKIPEPYGTDIDQAHHFELELDVLTLSEWFQNNIYYAIDERRTYPKSAIINGAIGSTTIDFDYLDGKAQNITIVKHTNGVDLDRFSLDAVERAQFPAPLPAYVGKTLHMEVIVCYSLNGSQNCPQGKNVILVQGTRVRVN